MDKKLKRIFSLKVANELVRLGCDIVKYEINIKNPLLKVFIFEDNAHFRRSLDFITFNK